MFSAAEGAMAQPIAFSFVLLPNGRAVVHQRQFDL
jgi:hypothetical protein